MLLIAVTAVRAVWSVVRLVLTAAILAGWHPGWRRLRPVLESSEFAHHGWKAHVGLAVAMVAELVVVVGFAALTTNWCEDVSTRGCATALLQG